MKKHNEGYTLPLVMVVLLVLAIVAVTIMTTSLKNMQRQQSFIEQMQAQYEAQGEIEKIVAQLQNGDAVTIEFKKDSNNPLKYDTVKLSGIIVESSGGVLIECGIYIEANAITVASSSNDSEETEGGQGTDEKKTITVNCKVDTITDFKYTSYEITKGGGT